MPIGGGQLAGWWVPAADPQAATLLYLHGNANNVGVNVDQVVEFHKAGLNVFIFEVGKFLPVRLILTERFDAISKIGSVRIPTLILEGERDRPLTAQRLYDAARVPKHLTLIPGGGHEDSAGMNPIVYFGALDSFLSQYHLKSAPPAAK